MFVCVRVFMTAACGYIYVATRLVILMNLQILAEAIEK